MSEEQRMPAMAFSLAECLCDEMKARGWTTDDVGDRMNVVGPDRDRLIFALLICVSQNDDRIKIKEAEYAGLSRAFDVSESFFRNIHSAWLLQKEGRQTFQPDDAMFGPLTRAALDGERKRS